MPVHDGNVIFISRSLTHSHSSPVKHREKWIFRQFIHTLYLDRKRMHEEKKNYDSAIFIQRVYARKVFSLPEFSINIVNIFVLGECVYSECSERTEFAHLKERIASM